MRELDDNEIQEYSRLPYFERWTKLHLAISNLRRWKKGYTERVMLERDVFIAAQIILLPYTNDNQTTNL